jgi:hypothetical protein
MSKTRIASAIVLLVLAARGIAPATIPAPDGTITGCWISSPGAGTLGALRVIDAPSATCDPTETALQWSQTGPPGPAGAGVTYIRYPWHGLFTELGHGFYYVGKLATTTMVLPSAGTWVVQAQIRWLAAANVDDCYLGLVDGITLPKEINPHEVGYLYYDEAYTWSAFARPMPILNAHATLTRPGYAVLRCLPHGDPTTDGVLEGGSVQAELQAWQVASAADTNGSTTGPTPPSPPLAAPDGTRLTSALTGQTASAVQRIAGRVRMTPRVRARIVLLSSYGASTTEIVSATRASPEQIAAVIADYNTRGLRALR